MKPNHGHNKIVANSESIPEPTNETRALDESEREYNRMISQHMTYHRMMMDDLMKLSAVSETSSANPSASFDIMNVVSGLGTTVQNLDASSEQLMQSAATQVEQGKQRALTSSKLNAFINKMGTNIQNDLKSYDEIMQKEGFDTMSAHDTSLDAALGISQTISESHKYALFVFGAIAMFMLYKTAKHL
jgi:ASC-1-like (ASCH) protein